MSLLVAVRHGQSESNERRIWTGLNDVPLTDQGRLEAQIAGRFLAEFEVHTAHTSQLQRAQESLKIMLRPQLRRAVPVFIPVSIDAALNERNYGDFTGVSKDQMREELGEEGFQQFRRSWDGLIPNGESLRQVHDGRVVPYYEQAILPQLLAGQNVLVVAHGNPLRALTKKVEGISDKGIEEVEFGTGSMRIWDLNDMGELNDVTVRANGAVH